MRLTNPKHGGVRSMRLPLSNQAEIYHKLAKYEDTGLEPEQVEALQQENERLKGAVQEWVDGICISQKYLSQIGKLQQENEQLQAQAARMREALENITEYWNGDSNEIAMMDACTNNRETAHEALAAISEVVGE